MDIKIHPGKLNGQLQIIPSKSQAHRLLICAAFADAPTTLMCPDTNQDIEATVDCLRALGAEILRAREGYLVTPIKSIPARAMLNCRESGSTLRFLLPVVGALGVDTIFQMSGRLPQRPLSPLWEEMERMGCRLSRPTADCIQCTGKLKSGAYRIAGNVSSQFISGLLFAHALMNGENRIEILSTLESAPYVSMTRQALEAFHAPDFRSPGHIVVEGDWSNAAFFLTAKQLGSNLLIEGLNDLSAQGDRAITKILRQLPLGTLTCSAIDIPDLVPILAVAAAAHHGAVFTDVRRLRTKESDRVESVVAMINALGGHATADENTITVSAQPPVGGTVHANNDHRIAMSAAIAATVCTQAVTICGAECVQKSYPRFWEEYTRLGGNYEQHIR